MRIAHASNYNQRAAHMLFYLDFIIKCLRKHIYIYEYARRLSPMLDDGAGGGLYEWLLAAAFVIHKLRALRAAVAALPYILYTYVVRTIILLFYINHLNFLFVGIYKLVDVGLPRLWSTLCLALLYLRFKCSHVVIIKFIAPSSHCFRRKSDEWSLGRKHTNSKQINF